MSASQKRLEIRDLIHQAAIREFARNGLSGTSTQSIAEAAGITKAQLHYYISSKEDLYREVLGDIVRQWKDIFFLVTSPGDPAKVIADYIDRKMRHALEYPDVSRLFAREMARGAPAMADHWDDLKAGVERATALIREWIDTGLMAPVDPLLFQVNIWAVTQHYADYEAELRVLMDVRGEAPLDTDRIISEATELFLHRCGLGSGCAPLVRPIGPPAAGPGRGNHPPATAAGDLVMTSGIHGIAPDGTVPGSVSEQAEICFSRIAAILAEQGLDFSHVLQIAGYVTRAGDIAEYEAARDRAFGQLAVKPSAKVLAVTALARPDLLVEVEVIAVRPFRVLQGAASRGPRS